MVQLIRKNNCPHIEECGLGKMSYVPWQEGKEPKDLLIIGQAPGTTEAITKIPFTGSAGKVLWRLLNEINLNRQDIPITNIVSCAPPNDRVPTPREISYCQQHIIDEINKTKPKLIIALGEVATSTLTDRKNIQGLRGQFFPLLKKFNYECLVLCLLHPAFIMRQRQWIDIATEDMKKVKKYLKNKDIAIQMEQPLFIHNPPPYELRKMLREMCPYITAVDIETPAELDVLTANIIGIAFYTEEIGAVAIDINPAVKDENWEIIKEFLEDENAKKVTQNGIFDVAVLETNGIYTKGLAYDTLLAEHTMHSDLPGNLDFLRGRYTKVPQYKPTKKEMKTITHWTSEKRLNMNCWDVVATYEVMLAQKKKITQEQLWVLENIELPLIKVCNNMERKGIKIDINTLALLHQKLLPQVEKLEKEVFNPLHLNPRSPKQLKEFFNITTTGEEELLAQIKRNHPKSSIMQDVLKYRKIQKVLSVYIIGVHNRLVNKRIHAHPKITGTGTGRLAYQNPNLQNIPVELRAVYIPDDKDHVFIKADYNQMELRVAALIAPEPIMLEQFAKGGNVHHTVAKGIYPTKEWDELTPNEQLRAKAVVFGSIYGRSARSIAIEHNVTIKKATEWQNICLNKYPGLQNYLYNQEKNFRTKGYCVTCFGRIRYLQTLTQAYNTPIQSTAADIVMLTLIMLEEKGFDLRVTVHDDIVIQTPRDNYIEVAKEFKAVMERPIKQLNNYSFPVKVYVGDDWFNVERIEI